MKKTFLVLISALILAPNFILAAVPAKPAFIYSGWVPYWKKTTGAADISANLARLSELSPFAYEVQADGTLRDSLKTGEAPWPELFAAMRQRGQKIIPSVLWLKGDEMYKTLSVTSTRSAHLANVLMVAKDYDGIDIDYENKTVATKAYFSAFIQELSTALHAEKKILACTVEPRTPDTSRFKVVPKDVAFANDYKVLAKYCDEFRIMAYDQRNIDLKLNAAKGKNLLYAPVADTDWVKKVVAETTKYVSPKKIMLGIPTYGHEYVANDSGPYRTYDRVRALTYKDAMELAARVGQKPARNLAGEMSFSYYVAPTSTLANAGSVAKGATHVVWWSDAKAVEAKIALAKKLGLKGVVLFRFDGESDPAIWSKLK
jgi:spore germination protein